jgi:hypothetical protein
MKLQFNTYGNEKQKQVCREWVDNSVTDIVYGGSKGSGKSYLGCKLIFSDAFTYPETFYFIARDSLTNIRKFTIPSIHEVFNDWQLTEAYYNYNGQDNYYDLHNGSRVYLLDAKYLPRDPLYARFGSMQMTRGWIEEAGEFTESAKNNLAASVGRWKNDVYGLVPKLLQTCNPAKNYLYSEYYKKHKEKRLEDWKRFVQALPQDNKRLPAGYLENLHRTLSANEKERLLYGNWEYDDDPSTLIEYDRIIDIWNNRHVVNDGKCYLSIDVARFGKDTAKLVVRRGWRIKRWIKLEKSSIPEQVEKARSLMSEFQIPPSQVIADEDGVGGGVVDYLKCKGFLNGSRALPDPVNPQRDPKTGTPIPENYDNLKSQCYFMLAKRINDGGLFIDCNMPTDEKEKLIAELEQVKQKNMDKDGKKAIVPKEVVKEKIGRSPDGSDALAMHEFFNLKKTVSIEVY